MEKKANRLLFNYHKEHINQQDRPEPAIDVIGKRYPNEENRT